MNYSFWPVRWSVLVVVAAFLSLSILPTETQARRLGGGGNFGRSAPSQFQKGSPNNSASQSIAKVPSRSHAANSAATGAASSKSRFFGPLGGLAAGLGLAALFGYMGLGAGMSEFLGTLLMIGAVVLALVLLVRMFRVQQASKYRPAYSAPGVGGNSYRQSGVKDPVPGMGLPADAGNAFDNQSAWSRFTPEATPVKNLPVGFDEANFLVSAQKFFVTMQDLFDKADMPSLREYCTDEVLEHLQVEIQARGKNVNRTDVVTIDAQLLGFDTDADEQIATVDFTGTLREDQDSVVTQVKQLWIMSRPVSGGGWVLAGLHNL